jgi:hypothetical protein
MKKYYFLVEQIKMQRSAFVNSMCNPPLFVNLLCIFSFYPVHASRETRPEGTKQTDSLQPRVINGVINAFRCVEEIK